MHYKTGQPVSLNFRSDTFFKSPPGNSNGYQSSGLGPVVLLLAFHALQLAYSTHACFWNMHWTEMQLWDCSKLHWASGIICSNRNREWRVALRNLNRTSLAVSVLACGIQHIGLYRTGIFNPALLGISIYCYNLLQHTCQEVLKTFISWFTSF